MQITQDTLTSCNANLIRHYYQLQGNVAKVSMMQLKVTDLLFLNPHMSPLIKEASIIYEIQHLNTCIVITPVTLFS